MMILYNTKIILLYYRQTCPSSISSKGKGVVPMDMDQIKTFLLIAKTKNFSRAASLLHLSQPSVTNRIRVLEDELGGKLFSRLGFLQKRDAQPFHYHLLNPA